MEVPAFGCQEQHGACGDEFDVVGVGEEGEYGGHFWNAFLGSILEVRGADGLAA